MATSLDSIKQIVIDYARSLSIQVEESISVEFEYFGFWILRRATSANVTAVADEGTIEANIWPNLSTLHSCILKPNDEAGLLLPLWIAFPRFSSVTSGWRQGTGEPYKYEWHQWWNTLSQSTKQDYRIRFPEPTDEEREEWKGGWEGFYDHIAEIPGNPNSIPDLLFGRVPRNR